MIKQLRRRFVLSITLSAFALLAVVVGSINFFNIVNIDRRTTELLDYICENDGVFHSSQEDFDPLDFINPLGGIIYYSETQYITRFFYVEFDENNEVCSINTQNIAAVDDETAIEYAKKALASGRTDGYGESNYKYKILRLGTYTRICFLDVSEALTYISSMIIISVVVSWIFFILLFVVILFASKRFIRPVEQNSLKQKQFIADAGHELKTPLAIISANTEVLEMTCGENDWTSSIRKQTGRMAGLVNNMLALAKMEERVDKKSFTSFSLSEIVENTADSFAVIAEQGGKKIKLSVWPGITLNGDEKSISELVTILVDNAVKYARVGTVVDIRLSRKNKSIIFETENFLINNEALDTERLFDRFYRADKSRSRETGGYGIGLSIAKAVAEKHKGSISAEIQDGKIVFTVILNNK